MIGVLKNAFFGMAATLPDLYEQREMSAGVRIQTLEQPDVLTGV